MYNIYYIKYISDETCSSTTVFILLSHDISINIFISTTLLFYHPITLSPFTEHTLFSECFYMVLTHSRSPLISVFSHIKLSTLPQIIPALTPLIYI